VKKRAEIYLVRDQLTIGNIWKSLMEILGLVSILTGPIGDTRMTTVSVPPGQMENPLQLKMAKHV